ncbi:MAG TPA: hypothetical protein VMF66_11135 [Candidatus Acidoferrum sp.]|nr:hypothetical protein [Candidatus Acidoferrum sp.]
MLDQSTRPKSDRNTLPTPADTLPTRSLRTLTLAIIAMIVAVSLVFTPAHAQQQSTNGAQNGAESGQNASPNGAPNVASNGAQNNAASAPRGIKLMLKDGTFQLVREYSVTGDRVRYYSLDRSDWEEIPASLVDWDATKKQENQTAQADASLLNKVRRQENQRRIMPLEVDASLAVAPGIFLPSGEGVFAFNGKSVLPLAAADPEYKLNKKHEIEKVMSPIPIVSERHSVLLKGAHSKVRIDTSQLVEFYVRVAPDQPPISLQLVKAEIHGETRKIARVDALFKMENATTHPLLMQRWQIAKDVFRFTLGQTLAPGEYALVQVIPGDTDLDQLSINVWDFGVDSSPSAAK